MAIDSAAAAHWGPALLDAASRWEEHVGYDAFEVVDSPSDSHEILLEEESPWTRGADTLMGLAVPNNSEENDWSAFDCAAATPPRSPPPPFKVIGIPQPWKIAINVDDYVFVQAQTFTDAGSSASGKPEVWNVWPLAHELGHVLGVGHWSPPGGRAAPTPPTVSMWGVMDNLVAIGTWVNSPIDVSFAAAPGFGDPVAAARCSAFRQHPVPTP